MNFIKIGNQIFSRRTIERVFIEKERNSKGLFSYFIYVLTCDEPIKTTEHETIYQAECALDEIYKMLNTEIIKE